MGAECRRADWSLTELQQPPATPWFPGGQAARPSPATPLQLGVPIPHNTHDLRSLLISELASRDPPAGQHLWAPTWGSMLVWNLPFLHCGQLRRL